MSEKASVSGILGLVFGILALLLSAVPIINNFAFGLAIIGLVFGIVALISIKKGKRSGKGFAITTIVLSAVAIAVVLISQQMYSNAIDEVGEEVSDSIDRSAGEKTDEILGREVDVKLGDFAVSSDEYGLVTTSLPVKVTNKLDEKKSYTIHVEALDSEGNRIVDDYVYANDLGTNQSQSFKVFQYIEESKLEAVKNAEFKIVSVAQV